MAKKASKKVAEKETVTENIATTQPAEAPKFIVAKRMYDRWYVYFQGVKPADNVGCGCKTAKSAIRYMHLLKRKFNAVISQSVYEQLTLEASKEA